MGEYSFLHPQFFWLLLLLPLAAAWHLLTKKSEQATLKVSSLSGFKSAPSLLARLRPALFVIRLLALLFLVIALARPRIPEVNSRTVTTEGIEIVMAMDISLSMLARDLKPNRMEALKRIAEEFVNDRPNDRIGLVVYAAESYTKTPVTSDHEIVKQAIRTVKYENNVIKDGTGIGTGLTTAVIRLKDSKAKGKVIILLTDGVNNSGTISPEMAAEIANKYDIKVYTIGIGSTGLAEQPEGIDRADRKVIYHVAPVQIDDDLMRNIAAKTGGKYFRATDNNSLKAVYDEINKLEKSELKDKRYLNYEEKFRPFLWIAFIFVVLEIILRRTLYRSFI